jgi:hypothetical protein
MGYLHQWYSAGLPLSLHLLATAAGWDTCRALLLWALTKAMTTPTPQAVGRLPAVHPDVGLIRPYATQSKSARFWCFLFLLYFTTCFCPTGQYQVYKVCLRSLRKAEADSSNTPHTADDGQLDRNML